MTLEQWQTVTDYLGDQVVRLCGLVAFVAAAVLGQAELIGEPWRHYVTVISIMATAIMAYSLRPYRKDNTRTRATDPKPKES